MTKVFLAGSVVGFKEIKYSFKRKKHHRTNQSSNEAVLAVKIIQEPQSNLEEKETPESTPVLSINQKRHHIEYRVVSSALISIVQITSPIRSLMYKWKRLGVAMEP